MGRTYPENRQVKCRKGSWTASLREEEQWGDPNFGGWMVLWKTKEVGNEELVEACQG
jgi:hypothetical protein